MRCDISWYGCDLSNRDRKYLAVGHTTSGGWWERRWLEVSPSIIWSSLTDLGNREIYWHDLHGELNPSRSHGSMMVYPLCYNKLTTYNCPQTIRKWVCMKNEHFLSVPSFVLQWNRIVPFLKKKIVNEYIETQIQTTYSLYYVDSW